MRFSAHSYLFHFSFFISTRVFKFNIEHLRDTKKANRLFTISKKSLNRNCAANQFIYFKRARKTKTETMCRLKILINAEQNPYGSIITSMLCSECWVFTEHLEHPENTPMIGRNICHGSDSVETAKKEIALWFKEGELNNYCCANNSWVYE